MRDFAQVAEAVSQTTSKLKKIVLLAGYLRSLNEPSLRAAAVFFTGRPFPLFEAKTLNVGWAALIKAIQEISAASDLDMHDAYLARGDLGEVAERLLPQVPDSASELSPARVASKLDELANTPTAGAKLQLVVSLLRALTPLEAKYIIKIITGDLRIGLKENTVEEAIAEAFGRKAEEIRRTNMAFGDIGETAVLARRGELGEIELRPFRPVKFMLATPAETEEDIFRNFSGAFYVEDKYDGIRGQLHFDGIKASLYSRTLDDVSHQFPEIIESAVHLPRPLIADGEVVAFKNDQVLAFSLLQKRLGRKQPPVSLQAEIPVALVIFDLLYLDGKTIIDDPLIRRKQLLQEVPVSGSLRSAPYVLLAERVRLEPFFEQAALRRNEGLMLKDSASSYIPGKRGMSWLKWKKALATLDVVVTGVEFGHGRRRNVLSDYTFAVRNNGQLLNIGKAYSGLTDLEIAEMTEFFKQHTVQDYGRFRLVEPTVVIEVAFNGIQKSNRHESGYALRFPRIVRIRTDKVPADIDSLESVEKIYRSSIGTARKDES
jgi:DNA ligase-1